MYGGVMSGISLIAVLLTMTVLTVFIYACYPKDWRKSKVNYALLFLHGIGLISALLVFACYKQIPDGLKRGINSVGTFWHVTVLFMAIFSGIRLLCSCFINNDGKTAAVRMSNAAKIIGDQKAWSAASLILSEAIAITGMVNFSHFYKTSYDVSIGKTAEVPALKISFCSDNHAGAGNSKKLYEDLRAALIEANPDVLLLGGDVFDETTSSNDVELVRSVLSSVHPKYGIYYVYGNHDDAREDWSAQQIQALNVRVLKDEMIEIEGVQIIGRLDPKNDAMELDQLFEACKPDLSKPLIVLQHRPSQLKQLGEKGVDLCLAGHTHGFNIPQFIAVGVMSDMYYGRKTYGNMTAIVSSGVSAWGLNYKFPAVNEAVTVNVSFHGG